MDYLTDDDYAVAKANGITYKAAYARVYRYGWRIKDAITAPLKRKEDELWPKYKEIAKELLKQVKVYEKQNDFRAARVAKDLANELLLQVDKSPMNN